MKTAVNKPERQLNCLDLVKRHEGFSEEVYYCPAGKRTIGYGYNLDANPLKLKSRLIQDYCRNGLCEAEAERLLAEELDRLAGLLKTKLVYWPELNKARQAALLDMAYNLGLDGLLKFKATLTLIAAGDYTAAATEMLNSTWSKQVKGRAMELAMMMKTGVL